jgi:O-antigen biosynthesis protein
MNSEFNEVVYLKVNPDVAEAVRNQEYASGYEHYLEKGRAEGRPTDYHAGVNHLLRVLLERDRQIADLTQAVEAMRRSTSWRLTRPWRAIGGVVLKFRRAWQFALSASRRYGGWGRTASIAYGLFRREGIAGLRRGMMVVRTRSASFDRNDYQAWVQRYATITDESRAAMRDKMAGFASQPLISVLMPVYNAPVEFLSQAIDSVRGQLYPNWELCIADDASTDPQVRALLEAAAAQDSRIKIDFRATNGHISQASNSALALAQGEFVALFDHDDLLTEHALYWIVEAINRNPDAGLIYSDEDKVDATNRRYDPYFKSELNYELLLAQNMICHLGVYRTSLLRSLGGFRTGFEGAQDYDLALRVIEQLEPAQVVHVPQVLYHWRAIAGSTALAAGEKNYAADAGRRAVAEHLARKGLAAEVCPAPEALALNRVRFACPSPQPLVSIIIPTKDRADLLGMCLNSLEAKTSYSNYEVIIVDNGSVEPATQALFDRLQAPRFKVVRDDSPFNYAALNNSAARLARGDLLCLMNNDIEILTPDWLEEMVSFALRQDVGCVGARLWYPDGRLQHGGVVVGVGGIAGHSHKYLPKGQAGYFARAVLHQSFSAVTAACLLVRRSVFEQMGGLDEQLVVAFNDVDFCLRVQAAGYRNVWTPYAEMNHHESASRGEEDSPEKIARFKREIDYMKARWGDGLLNDPTYSPNLTLDGEDFSYAWPPRVPTC